VVLDPLVIMYCKCLLRPVRAGESGGDSNHLVVAHLSLQFRPHPFGSGPERVDVTDHLADCDDRLLCADRNPTRPGPATGQTGLAYTGCRSRHAAQQVTLRSNASAPERPMHPFERLGTVTF
jgi:hypothetical protein